MCKLKTLALTAILAGAGTLVQAGEAIDPALAGCESELQAHFGADAEFKLLNKRRNRQGTSMRVAAKVDADHSYFATCWVPVNDIASNNGDNDGPMLAVSVSKPTSR